MSANVKTRHSHGILWAPSQDPAPSERRLPPVAETLERRTPPAAPPFVPLPLRREVGFFGAYGPLFYFVLLASIPVLGALLLFASEPDPAFQPVSDEELASLANNAPVPAAPAPATLQVGSVPADALVYIDGAFDGLTPYRLDGITPGWHAVALRKNGFAFSDTLIYLEAGTSATLAFALDSTALVTRPAAPLQAPVVPDPAPAPLPGSVQIDTAPAGADVEVDGRRVGRSPLRLRDVAPGTHEVTLALAGHASQRLRVVVAPGRQAAVRADLVPLTGTLSAVIIPWGSLFIDGVLYARDTDLRHDVVVPVGTHVVRAVHPVLGTQEWRVEVASDQRTSVDFDLN